ncbi:hypothetical protein DESUT3_40750 [Desulfuromonas versatilis]|uniref:Uncharacterized protein n=1 Tax=Desulfuromonas versatilis TaxID=2802975 RepID=A0ABM8I2J3_9BACT|nr:hypothetical protein DESUT3_40750 [Desulfuromonas versatilis]
MAQETVAMGFVESVEKCEQEPIMLPAFAHLPSPGAAIHHRTPGAVIFNA